MSNNSMDCVSKIFIQVLEDVAMMFADEAAADELPPPRGSRVAVSMDFTGDCNGSLELLTSDCTATEVAANVLGLDTEDPEAQESALDALKELLNVTLGQLLTEVAGERAVIDLSPPDVEVGVTDSTWHEFLEQEGTLAVVSDEQPILLNFAIRSLNGEEGSR